VFELETGPGVQVLCENFSLDNKFFERTEEEQTSLQPQSLSFKLILKGIDSKIKGNSSLSIKDL